MSALDILIVAVLLLSTLTGGYRGVVREAVSLIAWAMGIWLAFRYAVDAGNTLHSVQLVEALDQPLVRHVSGFVAVLTGSFLFVTIMGRMLKGVISAAGLSPIDRMLGLCFGFARGALIVVIGVTLASSTSLATSPAWQTSKFVKPARIAALMIAGQLPSSVSQWLIVK